MARGNRVRKKSVVRELVCFGLLDSSVRRCVCVSRGVPVGFTIIATGARVPLCVCVCVRFKTVTTGGRAQHSGLRLTGTYGSLFV